VCSNDLALAVSRFCTDVSVSDNLLVTPGICCAHTVSEDCLYQLTLSSHYLRYNSNVYYTVSINLFIEISHH